MADRSRLTVRIQDAFNDQMVTRHASGVQFKKTAPGGHHSASCTLSLPRRAFPTLGPADRLYIYDSRTARCLWEGYTNSPGTTADEGGGSFNLSAEGGAVLAQDNSTAVVFIERGLDSGWISNGNLASGQIDTVDRGFKLQASPGAPVGTGSFVSNLYSGLVTTGQPILQLGANVGSGKTDATWIMHFNFYDDAGTYVSRGSAPTFFTGSAYFGNVAGTDFTLGLKNFSVAISRTGGATNIADDTTWTTFKDFSVRPILSNAAGVNVTSGHSSNVSVLAHEVVNHLLGRCLPQIDGAGAEVAATTVPITQLSYLDGATPQQILDGLTAYEPNHFWEILESNAVKKHRFGFRAWPTVARYEVSASDGYNAPGGDIDLCNRVSVSWTDATGAKQSVVVTSTVEELGTRVRDAEPVTLPDGQGSAASAQVVGANILAQKGSTAPVSATAAVARPIMDLLRSRLVNPWEIEPGYLVSVRETGELLRLTEMDYDNDSGTTTLTLGTPVQTTDQIIARLVRDT